MSTVAPGRTHWAVAAGHAPSVATGPEPLMTSRDELSLLNAGDTLANVRVLVLYADREPVGPFRIGVAPRRLRRLRINDLIFPEAVRLDVPYGLHIESDVPIVVQFTRQDTRQAANAGLMTTAWPG
ncbi:MAG: Anabaena sensory rhodopsin transducer [uncultured Lysobacter sp.]|uniref:Sensory rhodopsin transducer n=1 Tax=uncultured Lysobacter sp. TaxID=271060 RepID=A0A6J4KN19_9GAMM|nr:MAG: Anabaena sensory rhodopsin transducer [uncultured Lysobacter sp.]